MDCSGNLESIDKEWKEGHMENKFKELGVVDNIVKSIEEMGFVEPTKVQKESIPYVLDNKDLIVMSKTGSGKTGAFGIPLIQNVNMESSKVQGLILTPTRELAVQVDKEISKMSKYMDVKTMAVYGQHNISTEIKGLKQGVHIITGTPGRVFDHISSKNFSTKDIKYLVLDEADRMLDMGFFDQVVKIIKSLPRERVTMLFSATMPPEIQRICQSYMKDPITLELGSDIKTVDTIKQVYYRVEKDEKRTQLGRIMKLEEPESCIIFCNTRTEVDRIVKFFAKKGYDVGALHGGNTQNRRMRTMDKFKTGKHQIIVATDVAARGLHIDELELVINYDVPLDKDSYIHRIGRTGRVGNEGKAITIVTVDDIWDFYAIEEHVGVLIEQLELPTDDMVNDAQEAADSEWVGKRKERIETGDLIDYHGDMEKQSSGRGKHGDRNSSKSHSGSNNRNRSNQKRSDHKHSDHKSHSNKRSDDQRNTNKQGQGSNKPKHTVKNQVPQHDHRKPKHHSVDHKPSTGSVETKAPVMKPAKKDIDYRQEAKKLMAKQKKPSLKERLGKLFGGK